MERTSKCYVCGGDIDRSKPHMGSIGADGMTGQRHTRDSDLCVANVDHALVTVAGMAHTLGLIMEQYSEASPVHWALQEAKDKLEESSKDILPYL